ncbi:MAG: ATP-dependent RNA helicase SrmB [Syntrophomonadaceae bacterium]|nr:ATP-dependent RNA helicase SrmB [Bacillota bacterium]
MLDEYFQSKNWNIVDVQMMPSHEASYYGYVDMGLSSQTMNFLERSAPQGIYRHQKESIQDFLAGKNVCLTTGAASGKSLVFYAAAIEQLVRSPSSKIIAIYPLRALGNEQEQRWKESLREAGLGVKVGRIDGQVPMSERPRILRDNQVLILTPDIIHAWLMRGLSDKAAVDLLGKVSIIIVDEVHNYTGVFGSNSAYLFRRMRHLMSLLGASPQYIAASATIAGPELHLKRLVGLDFKIIDSRFDTSPRHEVKIALVRPSDTKDLLTALSGFLDFIAKNTEHKFIAFVDSRKQTEYITSIVSRSQVEEHEEPPIDYNHLQRLNILPYRAGYEAHDRTAIQDRLSRGNLSGVVSTSALELGIDIPFLTLGVLVGVPRSATSFYQRIGRIGRHSKGEVVVINTGDVHSETIFRNPQQLLNMPLSEGALYLENTRIQYIHALCLARHGGEHDQVCTMLNMKEASDLKSSVDWPEGFLELCRSERIGVIPTELQNMKAQAGDDPHHTYPLRDVDAQFRVEHKMGPIKESRGSLSYSQLMREAYPGSVYYYITRPYRVYRVTPHTRLVEVRREKRYTTKPRLMPTLVFPNLTLGNVHAGRRYDNLIAVECNLQVREAIMGIKERRGPNELTFDYPLDPSLGLYFDQSRFTRNYFTTGVILTHPILSSSSVHCDVIANLLFEAFLMVIPFERRDINFASDRHRVGSGPINEGDRFISIFDQTYGSLRLSGRLLEDRVLRQVLEKCIELAHHAESPDINYETTEAIKKIQNSLSERAVELYPEQEDSPPMDTDRFVKVIMPGSKGLNVKRDNEEFMVDGVFFSPELGGLAYRGKQIPEKTSRSYEGLTETISISSLKEIPGESRFGLYCYETREIKE